MVGAEFGFQINAVLLPCNQMAVSSHVLMSADRLINAQVYISERGTAEQRKECNNQKGMEKSHPLHYREIMLTIKYPGDLSAEVTSGPAPRHLTSPILRG